MSKAFLSAEDRGDCEHWRLQRYLHTISQYTLMTSEEEAILVRRLRSGERAALDPLINANLHHVVVIAKTYLHRGLGCMDLLAEGTTGLIKAARYYDACGGFRFKTYATWWIARSIEEALDAESAAANRLGCASVRDDTETEADRCVPDDPTMHGRQVKKFPRATRFPSAESR